MRKFYLTIRRFIANFIHSKIISAYYFESNRMSYAPVTLSEYKEVISCLDAVNIDKRLIRVGGNGDGGYFVPDDFYNVSWCISPGIGSASQFDEDLLRRGVPVIMLDEECYKPIKLLSQYPNLCTFIPKYLGSESQSLSENYVSLSALLAKLDGMGVLQIDIEGNEWKILENLSKNELERFKFIVIELHQMHEICIRSIFDSRRSALKALTENHIPVKVCKNPTAVTTNYGGIKFPDVIEVTLVHQSVIDSYK